MDKVTKRQKIGHQIADGIIASISLYYNHQTQNKVLHHVIERLQQFAGQFEPKKATPAYKKARYGKKTEDNK